MEYYNNHFIIASRAYSLQKNHNFFFFQIFYFNFLKSFNDIGTITSHSVTHPHIAMGQARLTSKFYLNKLPIRYLVLINITIISILLLPCVCIWLCVSMCVYLSMYMCVGIYMCLFKFLKKKTSEF
jgi:hypothetical protein